ncbi:tripartite motif-containing protein 66 isoform 2-T2 [Clarias gariepinus]|uniref:tripartite motif-containing protein 66 isoform X2 n=1 Tax=Clarias gariepinus TaxID=13013 RepID=UPI00234C81FE|nr:tripartite motif-containing protein 66 isoform X2 [Clarias gariepinus]
MEKCCSECPEPRLAQSLCTFCNKWLCFQCTDLHQHERALAPAPPESRHHPSSSSPTAPPEPGSACCGRAVVMCPLHKQELLELFCETCDLLACSICHLSAHKDHRLVHVGKALQDQRWLLENLMARVEEKRSAVENTAKQIQGRLHSVKITQRKAENQIKMAKMIMMNELNKRANLLIEQLESISSGFKQHLEDQLQGAIELCSQLEHVQNFITWAVAHHRRNPLLFSKELIALQMQQLLEPLIHSEAWAPLKIKFNWDASFWTKQISTLGQLSVEGGSRAYTEGVARPAILRPQPVPCVSVPSLCYPVRETDCSYQSFCQHQLCCLHCRPVPSVPLEKYPHPLDKYSVPHAQEPSCSSPPSLQGRWNADAAAQAHPSQNSTRAESARRTPAPETPGEFQPRSVRERPTDQLQDSGDTDSGEERRVSAQADEDRRNSGATDMLLQDARCEVSAESPESRTGVCGVSAEPGASGGAAYGMCSLGANQSRGTAAQQQPDYTSPPEGTPEDEMIRLHPDSRDGSSQTVYKTEPESAYAYSYENTSCTSPDKCSTSRNAQDTSKAPDGSKVPVVCLERLKILVSKCPPQGHHSTAPPADSRLKCEGIMAQELERELSAEEESSEDPGQRTEEAQLVSEPQLAEYLPCSTAALDSESSLREMCNINQECSEPSTAPVQSSDPEASTPPESNHASDPNPPESRSAPVSDLQPESTAEADFGSDVEVESELQAESDPSSTSEPPIELDSESDPECEQVPEISAESEHELESDADSTAEVTLNLDQECEWEAERVGAGASVQQERPRVGVVEQDCEEMESEDFCAVCSIGGELLCCDRCPKVFHLTCHVPSLLSFPTGDWVCSLCRDAQRPETEYDCEDSRLPANTPPSALSACDLRKCEKLTLLIYSNILSAPFHEPVSPLARHYYQIIKRPMDLSIIRSRLRKSSSVHYSSVREFVTDVLLMFKNCAKFNYPDSEVAQAGRSLQTFFFSKLGEVFPELSCPAPDDDSESDDYEEPECAAAAGFPWPERREQSHRKRKRRRSLSWRRHHY